MAKKVFNMQGGRHSAAALSAFINAMYGSSVANGLDVQPTGSAGLNVLVKVGNGNINTGTGFGRLIQIDADETVALTAASASNPRNDIIVAYIDNSVTPTTAVTDNTNNILKFAAVAGTPAGSPTDPSGSAIQAAVGAGNPYMILGRVRVNTSATSLTAPNITDLRKIVMPITSESSGVITTAMLSDGVVTTSKIAGSQVTPEKINFSAFGNKTIRNTSDFTTSSTSFVDKLTTTLDAGTYIVMYSVTFRNFAGTANGECNVSIRVTGSSNTPITTTYLPNASYNSTTNSGIFQITVPTNGTVVALQTSVNWPARGTYTSSANDATAGFIRVG